MTYLRPLDCYLYPSIFPFSGKRRKLCKEASEFGTLTLNVLTNEKAGRRTILNFDDIVSWTSSFSHKPEGMFLELYCRHLPAMDITRNLSVKYNILRVNWATLNGNLSSQLHLLGDTNIYITSPGAGAFNAIFLPDGTSVITSPFCGTADTKSPCLNLDGMVLHEHLINYDTFIYSPASNKELVLPPAAVAAAASNKNHTSSFSYDIKFESAQFSRLLSEATHSVLSRVFSTAS